MTQPKQTVVSFRVDQHLAELLNNLPDKSAFIREAILRRFHTTCPFCGGRGVLPRVIADWLQSQQPPYESAECACCHYRYPVDLIGEGQADAGTDPFTCSHCRVHDHDH